MAPRLYVTEKDGRLWFEGRELAFTFPHDLRSCSQIKPGGSRNLRRTVIQDMTGKILVASDACWHFYLHRCPDCERLFIGHGSA